MSITLGEVARLVERVEVKVDVMASNQVTRAEWQMYRDETERRFRQIEHRRVPWTATAAVLIAAGALLASLGVIG